MAPSRPKQLTIKQHERYGLFLKLFRDGLLRLFTVLQNTYGVSHKLSQTAYQATEAIDQLRFVLDDAVCGETSQDYPATQVYYGHRQWDTERIIDRIASLDLSSQTDFDLDRLLDSGRVDLTARELMALYDLQKSIDLLLSRCEIPQKEFERLALEAISRKRSKLEKILDRESEKDNESS